MTPSPVVLQLLPSLGIGGVEQGAVDMAEAVAKAGGRALVASASGSLLPHLRYVGGEFRELPLPKKWSPFVFRRKVKELQTLIRRDQVQLVHARSRYPAWVAAQACKRENIPLVTTWHGVHKARSFIKRSYNTGLLQGDRVIAVSSHIAQRLQAEYGVSAERLVTIARGSDPQRFSMGTVSGPRVQALVDRWHIPEDQPVIVLPGRVTSWKGHALLVEALGQLAVEYPAVPWVCVFVGPETDPAFARRVHRRACDLGIADRLRFVGPCEDMPAVYTLAHMVVVPSCRPEPFGRVAVEAQMMGCPVIGSAQGGLAETIIPHETGLLVPPQDSGALEKAIVTFLMMNPYDRAEMGECAVAHVLQRYTKQQMQRETLGVYDALLGTSLQGYFGQQQGEGTS
ncbi:MULTISPECIES: glycosyltransferase family 4 protein [unclassified Saccharibacter]|uniref:glycosyltransferase family 4 protein n=1 Tax=unclassified Saccharibacter TaxID=2648722 RepID=UPI001320ABD2|nr:MULTISPECIES: glycosyltransferase family 4 protein [unclassified Saccharibacter]MXV37021.1 glycosyltransferase [Saccharibacter sp. EH611]MXV58489.1 glycosyltransferase [Saccharibacter sp. EH70]MXV65995.1 glycosyltransferase [Saccharibacter sp. EH60]